MFQIRIPIYDGLIYVTKTLVRICCLIMENIYIYVRRKRKIWHSDDDDIQFCLIKETCGMKNIILNC